MILDKKQFTNAEFFNMSVYKLSAIIAKKGLFLSQNLKSSALGSEHEYEMNDSDKVNIGLLIINGEGGYFSCNLNGERTRKFHTHEQLKPVVRDGEAAIQAILSDYYVKKAAVLLLRRWKTLNYLSFNISSNIAKVLKYENKF